jgi:hypothetical protein
LVITPGRIAAKFFFGKGIDLVKIVDFHNYLQIFSVSFLAKGATKIAEGKAIGKTIEKDFNQLESKSVVKPILITDKTPEMIRVIVRDIKNAKIIFWLLFINSFICNFAFVLSD